MDSVLSTEGIVRFFVAFVIVLALIGVTFWLIRRFGGARVGAAAQRGRAPRLAVIDAAAVDGRRRLVLVRRDNVEHLLMIGGPSDLVVEQNILRAVPVNAPRDMPSPRAAADAAQRASEPARPQSFDDDAAWQQPQAQAQPEVPARPSVSRPDLTLRPRAIEPRAPLETPRSFDVPRSLEPRAFEPRPPAEPRAFEAAIRPMPAPAPAPRAFEPPPIAPAEDIADEEAPPDAALASMAQRLEAALRRPGANEPAGPAPRSPSIQTTEQRIEEAFALPQGERTPTAPDAPDAPHNGDKGAKPKSVLDSLEEEMASLLGRPPDKT